MEPLKINDIAAIKLRAKAEKQQRKRCRACVWRRRGTGRLNCLFPRCVMKEPWAQWPWLLPSKK
jgi:hypothetical protein